MTYTNKLLTYLGFCPSKESAQGFITKNNPLSERTKKWKTNEMMTFTGVFLFFVGMTPYYFEDTSITGVTDTIILHGKLGFACFILGAILIIFGTIIPRIITKLRIGVVEGDCL